MSPEIVLFIDANQYLVLFNALAGKKLLDALEEQKAYIFVTTQVVEEVQRNKIEKAVDLLSQQVEKLNLTQVGIPDHLFGISDDKTTAFRRRLNELRDEATKIKSDLVQVAKEALSKISRSEDDVSKRLMALFDKAVSPKPEEVDRARNRKERGTPPGKPEQPLGDQINWEQLVSHCKGAKRIWIVTEDTDFCTSFEDVLLLNPVLHDNLKRADGTFPAVFCFRKLLEGLTHFKENAGVKAEKVPTGRDAEEIKKALETVNTLREIPPLDGRHFWIIRPNFNLQQWLSSDFDFSSDMPRKNLGWLFAPNPPSPAGVPPTDTPPS